MKPIQLQPFTDASKIDLGRTLLLLRKNDPRFHIRHLYVVGHMERHPNNYLLFVNDHTGAEVRNVTHWAYLKNE